MFYDIYNELFYEIIKHQKIDFRESEKHELPKTAY